MLWQISTRTAHAVTLKQSKVEYMMLSRWLQRFWSTWALFCAKHPYKPSDAFFELIPGSWAVLLAVATLAPMDRQDLHALGMRITDRGRTRLFTCMPAGFGAKVDGFETLWLLGVVPLCTGKACVACRRTVQPSEQERQRESLFIPHPHSGVVRF